MFRVHIHDITLDPLGWNTRNEKKPDLTLSTDFHHLLTCQKSTPGGALVVIDSLTPLITYRSAPYTCNLLHQLKNSGLIFSIFKYYFSNQRFNI